MRSFERIDYSIRPNKHIERRLIFESLQSLEPFIEISKYRYIGLGSMWFTDFILAHKQLGIEEMISIEAEERDARRADFNRPYKTVTVFDGTTDIVLPNLYLPQGKALVWLDYDGNLDGMVLSDLALLGAELPAQSILLVTVNANAPRAHNDAGREAILRGIAGSLVPPNLPATYFDRVPAAYPNSLSQMLFDHLSACLRNAGRTETMYPLFNIYYADGAPMITIGAALVDDATRTAFDDWKATKTFECVTGRTQYVIDAPRLTPREKLLFDQLLPADGGAVCTELTKLGLPFSPEQVERYARLYRHYPLFAEFWP